MSRQEFIPQVPYGTKDILPLDAARKRGMENELARLFLSWGYQEVVTPTFEYYETLRASAPAEDFLQGLPFLRTGITAAA